MVAMSKPKKCENKEGSVPCTINKPLTKIVILALQSSLDAWKI